MTRCELLNPLDHQADSTGQNTKGQGGLGIIMYGFTNVPYSYYMYEFTNVPYSYYMYEFLNVPYSY